MKSFRRRFTPLAAGQICKLPPAVKAALRALTDGILEDPSLGKALKDELLGFYSIRHNRYRVIYEIDLKKREIIIEYVGLRENVYEIFTRLRRVLRQRVI